MSVGELPPESDGYVIATIEQRHPPVYWKRMPRLLLHWLALVAMMLMPFGMASAPAAAASAAGHHSTSAMPAGHCEDAPADHAGGGIDECAMPCSAALPAADLAPASSEPLPRSAARSAALAPLAGIELEIATPPPRFSEVRNSLS